MTPGIPDRTDVLSGYPTLNAAARMLGISPSTLCRRKDLAAEARGERDRILRAREVMRLATVYRRRSLNEVGAELLVYARKHAPGTVGIIERRSSCLSSNSRAHLVKGPDG